MKCGKDIYVIRKRWRTKKSKQTIDSGQYDEWLSKEWIGKGFPRRSWKRISLIFRLKSRDEFQEVYTRHTNFIQEADDGRRVIFYVDRFASGDFARLRKKWSRKWNLVGLLSVINLLSVNTLFFIIVFYLQCVGEEGGNFSHANLFFKKAISEDYKSYR